jgi:hypothetical protein
VKWNRSAKWGMFIHYALPNLCGINAKQALATQNSQMMSEKN